MKVISFIIPAYNSEAYLNKCIDSMVSIDSEALKLMEIIVVNDGSADSTEAVALEYKERFPDIVNVVTQTNKGHGGAINSGVSVAGGKYFKVIDADDWVFGDNLKSYIEKLGSCESDVVLTHYKTLDISNGEIREWKSTPAIFEKEFSFSEIIADFPKYESSLTFHGITYNTTFYKSFDYQLSEHIFYEDHEYATFPCCYANTVTCLDMFIYNYRIGDVHQSVSDSNQLKRMPHLKTVLNRMDAEYINECGEKTDECRSYVCYKIKTVLLSYLKALLLINKDKANGRALAEEIMVHYQKEIPFVYELSVNQYKILCLFNRFHLSKGFFDKLITSSLYRKFKGKA